MRLCLIICTYKRPEAIKRLLVSVKKQSLPPNQVVIVDASEDQKTRQAVNSLHLENLEYYQVEKKHRGLTKQRNFGISKVKDSIEVTCFLDDDVTLKKKCLEELINTYKLKKNAIAVGGYITNEVKWSPIDKTITGNRFFQYDGYYRKESSRFLLRRVLGLNPDQPPGIYPKYGHGRSISFLPPSGKIYPTEQLIGAISSFKTDILRTVKFSEYFEGYGLYEDADFCFRILPLGKLYVNTAARCEHHHDPSGRPHKFKYGKMVVRNGWYVWKVRYPEFSFVNSLKWHSITLLLSTLRFLNFFTTKDRYGALQEAGGRFYGWVSLIANKPKPLAK
ncbi:glycosyltransferase family A protein [Ascidiimonas aurantiaca]|uniref:glycosyltransferase family 2 protein n=1 Tax=Ascidiimonas aurantiaca TaxID=1685432 RepID=UPI0030ED601A